MKNNPDIAEKMRDLKDVGNLLKDLNGSFTQSIWDQQRTKETPAILVQYGMIFVSKTIKAMILLVETDESNAQIQKSDFIKHCIQYKRKDVICNRYDANHIHI